MVDLIVFQNLEILKFTNSKLQKEKLVKCSTSIEKNSTYKKKPKILGWKCAVFKPFTRRRIFRFYFITARLITS